MCAFRLRSRMMFGVPVPPSYLTSSFVVMPNLRAISAMVSPLTIVYAAALADPLLAGGGLRTGLGGGFGGGAEARRAAAAFWAFTAPGDTVARLALVGPLRLPPQLHPITVPMGRKRYNMAPGRAFSMEWYNTTALEGERG